MSLPLPTLRGTSQQALYPFRRTIKCSTLLSKNQDGSRQVSILDSPRVQFDLPFTKLSTSDKNAVMAYTADAIGQSATDGELTLGNVTYTNLSLESDLYSGKVRIAVMWDSGLKLSQTQAQNLRPSTTITANVTLGGTSIQVAAVAGFNGYLTIGTETMLITDTPDSTHFTVTRGALGTTAATHTSGATVSWGPAYALNAAFPALPNLTRTQTPWEQNQQYKTEAVQMSAGQKWTYPWYGGALVDFPTEGLRQWVVGGEMLTDADVAVIEAHFLANWGRFGTFTFTDPATGSTYANAYYTSDEMTIEYVAPNVNRVTLPVEAYNQGSGIVSATLHVLTSHIPGGGYSGIASYTSQLPWGYSTGAFFSGFFVFDNSSFTLRSDTDSLTGRAIYSAIASFMIEGTLLGDASPPDEVRVYDTYLQVVYSSGSTLTYRPTKYGVVNFTGTVTNPENAIDGNPATYASVQRAHFSGGGTPTVLQVSGFSL